MSSTPSNNPVPLVLVVGFLGAGKTTFLRDVLPLLEERALQPFTIINDYSNARVDASSLSKEGRIVAPINGNCICCDSVSELINILLEVEPSEKRIVLIEANGTTDPTALIEHLLIKPELRQRFAPVLQVTLVDLKRWQKRHWHNDLERLQVETASHLVFTRTESESKMRLAKVQADIEWFNPRAVQTDRQAFAAFLQKLASNIRGIKQNGHITQAHSEHLQPDNHAHSDERHQLAHGFAGLEVSLPDPMPSKDLQQWLMSLPAEVLRVKGVVRLMEEPERWFKFQRVDNLQGEATLNEMPQKPSVPACAVLIGVRLDANAIREGLARSQSFAVTTPISAPTPPKV